MESKLDKLFCHKLVEPNNYQRRFDNDLPQEDSTLKRAVLIALPFVSLYQPLGSAISLSMGTCRSVTHLSASLEAFKKQDYKHYAGEMAQTALAVLSIAATLSNFSLGLIVTTAADLSMSLYRLPSSGEEALQALSSALYLGIIFTGSLEIILASALLQTAISLYQAKNELAEQRYPEAAAKMMMSLIRMRQSWGHYQTIQSRNALLSIDFFKALSKRVEKGRGGDHLLDNPLVDLDSNIDAKRVTLEDETSKEIDFGSHFHGHGEALVKGMNLAFRTKVINGKEVVELDFKVNHVFRTRLAHLINEYKKADPEKLKTMLSLSHSHVKDMRMEMTSFPVGNHQIGTAHKFTLEGVGTLFIGASADCYNLYDRVVLRFDRRAGLFACHEALSLFDLDHALYLSAQEDIERLKIGHLFRILCPKEATSLERSDEFFNLPIEDLKRKIIALSPQMNEAFVKYLPQMQLREILPGRMRYAIPGLAKECYDLGARGLIASITGAHSQTALFDRVAAMIKMGIISSETRKTYGIDANGLSSGFDFYTGGADSIFTQLVTEKQCKDNMPLDDFAYFNTIALMFPLEVLETGTYQYHYDSFGVRSSSSWWGSQYYSNRPGLFDFVRERQNMAFPDWFDSNEVMVKERIASQQIQGIIVRDELLRSQLLEHLRKRDLVQKDGSGIESILGVPTDRFIRVATNASESLFKA